LNEQIVHDAGRRRLIVAHQIDGKLMAVIGFPEVGKGMDSTVQFGHRNAGQAQIRL
jgi:hypothetical protein